jgi:hypothetical protein
MAKGVSRRGYARLRGCSETAVRKALAQGRIDLEPDGTIDPEKADHQWAASTIRSPGPVAESVEPARYSEPQAHLPPLGRRRTKSTLSLVEAQTAKAEGEAHLKRLQIQKLEGELLDRGQATRFVFKLFRSERDAWMSWPARVDGQIAGQINAIVAQNGSITQREVNLILDGHVRQHLADLGKVDLEQFQVDSEAA